MNNSNSPRFDKEYDSCKYKGSREAVKVGKVNVLWLILKLIFLVIFNVFFFVLGGTEHNASVWMSYSFIHLAYFMLMLTPQLTRKGKSSAVFGFALYSVSATYFIIALITGVVFILIAPENHTTALLVQLSIAGLYGVMLISHLIANEQTADAEEKRQYQIEYVKTATAQLKKILDNSKDRDIKRKVERVYDAVNSSPVKSHPNVAQIEMRIFTLIGELADAVAMSEKQVISSTADSLLSAANERNNKLKAMN